VPKEYIPGVEKGIKSVMDNGPLAGFPVIDFKVTLIDGAFHDVDSSVLAFEIAARAALRDGSEKGRREAARADHEGRSRDPGRIYRFVIGDLNSRRGMIQARTCAATRTSSTRWCRWPTCSATSTTCACLRAARVHDAVRPLRRGAGNVAEEVIQKKYA
jgi:translation elongation factor EF-G